MDEALIREGVEKILAGLGIKFRQDDNFKDTPTRVARAYKEIFSGLKDTDKQIEGILSVAFPAEYSQMIVANDIVTYGMCPHHLLPVRYEFSVGYIPSEKGKVLGLSKLPRLVEILAHRPVLQEKLTDDVTHALMQVPGCIGAACIASGEHHCMSMRGVKQRAVTTTSSLRGVFLSNPSVKDEFFRLVRK